MKKSIVMCLMMFGAVMSHAIMIEQTDYVPARRGVLTEQKPVPVVRAVGTEQKPMVSETETENQSTGDAVKTESKPVVDETKEEQKPASRETEKLKRERIEEGFYVSARGGGLFSTSAGGCDLYGGAVAVGYKFSPWLRLELEGGYYAGGGESFYHSGSGWYEYGEINESRLFTLIGQFYVDVPTYTILLNPYATVGLGFYHYYEEGYYWGGYSWGGGGWSYYGGSYTHDESGALFNLGIGNAISLGKRTSLDIMYRYLMCNAEGGTAKFYNLSAGIRYIF